MYFGSLLRVVVRPHSRNVLRDRAGAAGRAGLVRWCVVSLQCEVKGVFASQPAEKGASMLSLGAAVPAQPTGCLLRLLELRAARGGLGCKWSYSPRIAPNRSELCISAAGPPQW